MGNTKTSKSRAARRTSWFSWWSFKSSSRRRGSATLLGKSQFTAVPALILAALCAVGGYALVSHSFAASGPPEVASGYSGKCLDDLRNGTSEHTIVDIFTCNGTAAQQWAWSASGTQIMLHGKCLSTNSNLLDNGRVIELNTCNGLDGQTWKAVNGTLVNPKSNRCLNAPDPRDGNQLQIWNCDAAHATSEKWTFTQYAGTTTSGTPQIQSVGVAGKCVDDFHNGSANGNKVNIWLCNGTAAQQWTMNSQGRITLRGNKCLDVFQGKLADGVRVDLYPCKSSSFNNQLWSHDNLGRLVTRLSYQSHVFCLAPSGSANGSTLQIATCSTNSVQKWSFNSYHAASTSNGSSSGSGGTGNSGGSGGGTAVNSPEIQSLLGNRCLDDFQNKQADGSVVDVWNCNGSSAQQWVYSAASKYLQVHGKCLDVKGGGKSDGTVTILYACHNGDNQKWNWNATQKTFTNVHSGTCLNVPGPRAAGAGDPYNGLQLQIWRCDGRTSEQWNPNAKYSGQSAATTAGSASSNTNANPATDPITVTDANTGNPTTPAIFNFPTPTPMPSPTNNGCPAWMSFFCGSFND
jgi:hypothetical protein